MNQGLSTANNQLIQSHAVKPQRRTKVAILEQTFTSVVEIVRLISSGDESPERSSPAGHAFVGHPNKRRRV
jgi:hypothetical protein